MSSISGISYVNSDDRINKISYHFTKGRKPTIMFLPGFGSNMTGNKAIFLESCMKAQGFNFVRFDYRGHGQSDGNFLDFCLSDWISDALTVFDEVLEDEPVVVVGSSMGGWIALHLAIIRSKRVCGLVGIASAPDFLERKLQKLTSEELETLSRDKVLSLKTEYEGFDYRITEKMFKDGSKFNLLDNGKLEKVTCPIRLLHGTKDNAVPWEISSKILDQVSSTNATLVLIKDGDHRLGSESDLDKLKDAIGEIMSTL